MVGKTGFTMWIWAGSMYINQTNYLRAPGCGKKMLDGSGREIIILNGSTTRGSSSGSIGRVASVRAMDGFYAPRMM